MNDTHGVAGTGWYDFDLDGTLAIYDKWEGIDHIGEPVKPMVDLIKKMHGEGKTVKVLTARVSPRPNPETKPNPFAVVPWATAWMDVPKASLASVFMMLDTHRRRLLAGYQSAGGLFKSFDASIVYQPRENGGIRISFNKDFYDSYSAVKINVQEAA